MKSNQPRDAKGRYTKRTKDNEKPKEKEESVNSENPDSSSFQGETLNDSEPKKWRFRTRKTAQTKPPDDSKGTALSTTRRDRPHADERNDPRYFRNRARDSSYNAGRGVAANLRNFLDTEINGQINYEFPDWLKGLVKSEVKHFRNHLKRSELSARKSLYNQILSLDLLQLVILILAIVSVNIYTPLATQFNLPLGQYFGKDSRFNGATDAIYSKAIQVGDKVNGYEITSGFGMRTLDGVTRPHEGIDAATPVGTTIYGIGTKGTGECLNDPKGYGLYAVIKPADLPYDFLFGHLEGCDVKEYEAGQGIGVTGNSGSSTGPHLHFEMINRNTGEKLNPTEGYLQWALQGNPPKPHGFAKAIKGWDGLTSFADIISTQESNKNYQAVNEIGMLGAYQFDPETLASVAPNCVGKNVSSQEFLGNHSLQDQVARCYWEPAMKTIEAKTSDPMTQCRMLASYHYSGDINLWDGTAAQGSAPDGTPYPSIAEYTSQVCNLVIGQ